MCLSVPKQLWLHQKRPSSQIYGIQRSQCKCKGHLCILWRQGDYHFGVLVETTSDLWENLMAKHYKPKAATTSTLCGLERFQVTAHCCHSETNWPRQLTVWKHKISCSKDFFFSFIMIWLNIIGGFFCVWTKSVMWWMISDFKTLFTFM